MGRGKVATRNLDKIHGKQIVLDTSIIIFFADKDFRGQIGAAVNQLETQGNELFVSEVTLYELNKVSRTAADMAAKSRILERFSPLPLTQNRFAFAGLLYSVMKGCQSDFKNKENDIGCDMIIGGTVVENNTALLMTTNVNDFRFPCWKTLAEGRVTKKSKGGGWVLENWYLLEFDYSKMPREFLSDELAERYYGGQATLLLPSAP